MFFFSQKIEYRKFVFLTDVGKFGLKVVTVAVTDVGSMSCVLQLRLYIEEPASSRRKEPFVSVTYIIISTNIMNVEVDDTKCVGTIH